MKLPPRLLASALLLAAASAHAGDLRGSATAGFGVARDGLGVELELGAGHWTVLAGFGERQINGSGSFSAGARWSLRPDGSGFGVAAQASIGRDARQEVTGASETLTVVSATAHWRWKWSWFVLDAGIGPALSLDSYRYPQDDYGADNGRLVRTTSAGVSFGFDNGNFPFDLELGLGFAF